ncbi:MAG: hypothetical protein LBT66_06825 [Methanobrevibacter sp.]|jgi:hypothetical protein|nr:hypothetical protein [Candidatus Methanovirga meridionalis]
MDKNLKILCAIVIIGFLTASAYGTIKGGVAEKKGKIEVGELRFTNNSEGLNTSYAVSCMVITLVSLDYLKMKTIYYDKDANILAKNNCVWEERDLLSSTTVHPYENIGYNAGPNGKLPVKVDILFFDDPNKEDTGSAIYHTSLMIKDGEL